MAVDATLNTDPLTITPTKVRYSLSLVCLGEMRRGIIKLQRSDRREDGMWLDDPRPASCRQAVLPMGDAVDGLIAFLPTILATFGISEEFSDYHLRLTSRLDNAGAMDVLVAARVKTASGWVAKIIPSLVRFLDANPDIAPQAIAVWEALDVEVNAKNRENGWL